MELTALPITYRTKIPPEYQDAMGHMNVMWYAHLADRATFSFLGSFGFDEAYCRMNQAGCFALAAHYRYLVEIRIGQLVTVRSRALGRSAKRLHLMHFLTIDEKESELACTIETVGTHVDLRTRRSSPLPPAIAAAFDQILAECRKLPWPAPLCGAIRV
jgi:acyl-CoA thioester hydrolase